MATMLAVLIKKTVTVSAVAAIWKPCTHTHTHPFNGPFSRTTRVGRYQKGKTNLDFTTTQFFTGQPTASKN